MSGGPARLRRTLDLPDAVVVGLASMVGAGVFVVWGPATAAAGGLVLVALAVAGGVATCNALSTAALAARSPSAGGAYLYGRERLGEVWGYLAGWCFVVGKTASCAAMALTAGVYLAPGREQLAALCAVLLTTALNLAGVRRSVSASRPIVAVVGCVLLAVAVAALLPGPGGAVLRPGELLGPAPRGLPGLLEAAGLLFFAFAGYARIATLGEEVRDPRRTIPRAVVLALGSVLVLYLLVGAVVLGVLGADGVEASAAPVAAAAAVVWGGQWVWVVRLAAGLAALGALLNLLLGISRTALAMARDGHLPRVLAAVGGPGSVPRVAEVAVGLLVAGVVLLGDLRAVIGVSSFGVLLYYAVANAAALTLGRQGPPRAVPLLGLLGCLVLAVTLPPASVVGGAVVVGAGLLAFLARRGRGGRRGRGKSVRSDGAG